MTYSTKDYNLAAYLIVSGCSLTGHRHEQNLTIFEFAAEEPIADLVEAYYGMKAVCNPLSFGNALRSIRTIISSEKAKHHATNNYVPQSGRPF